MRFATLESNSLSSVGCRRPFTAARLLRSILTFAIPGRPQICGVSLKPWLRFIQDREGSQPICRLFGMKRWSAIRLCFTLLTDLGEIDLLAEVAGLGNWEDVKARSVEIETFDRTISILDLPGLIQAKRAAGRQKDLAALPELESLLEAREPDTGPDD